MTAEFSDFIDNACRRAMAYRLRDPAKTDRGQAGFYRGQQAGSSLDYKDFREYQPGDDPRHIDWNAYGRTDKPVLKLFHDEVIPHLDLILDISKSMALAESAKEEATLSLCTFFATAARNAGFSHRVWLAGADCRPLLNGENHPRSWPLLSLDHEAAPGPAIMAAPGLLRNRGLRIFISDLMWEADPTSILASLCRNASAVLTVQLLAQADTRIPVGGKVRLIDSETGSTHEIQLHEAEHRRYTLRLARHRQQWREAATRQGAVFTEIMAEPFLEQWLFDDNVLRHFLQIG